VILDGLQPNIYVGLVLPGFTEDGLLPEGLHRATWDEVVARFGWTRRRRRLLGGLQAAAANLRDAGARYLWLDGSFTTVKPDPDDYDCAWDAMGVDLAKVDPILTDLEDQRTGRYKQKAKYNGELLVGFDGPSGMLFQVFFQQDRNGNTKGIVLLELGTLP
jgi:hypothetical protein